MARRDAEYQLLYLTITESLIRPSQLLSCGGIGGAAAFFDWPITRRFISRCLFRYHDRRDCGDTLITRKPRVDLDPLLAKVNRRAEADRSDRNCSELFRSGMGRDTNSLKDWRTSLDNFRISLIHSAA